MEYLTLTSIAHHHDSTDPAAYVINTRNAFKSGKVCIGALVYIPLNYSINSIDGEIVEGNPPDALYMEILGYNFQVVPQTPKNYELHAMADGSIFRYYQIIADFRDADDYKISGYLEYVDYQWNFGKKEDVSWNPFPLKFITIEESGVVISDEMQINILGSRLSYNTYDKLPYCTNGNASGRWVKSSFITSDLALYDYDPKTFLKDSNDRIWLPFDCKYRIISHSDFLRFFSNTPMHLHFYGDSNIRRSLKVITTGGSFCKTKYDAYSKECECNDKLLNVPFYNQSNSINYFPQIGGNTNISIYYHDMKGLISWKEAKWEENMERTRLDNILSDFGHDLNIKPAAVIVGFSNWDIGYDTFGKFKEKLPKFLHALKRTYKDVPIIWRPSQYYCCRVDHSKRKRMYSRLRSEVFNTFALKEFYGEFPNQLYIWDVWALGAAQFPQIKANITKCDSNHMSINGIDLENQILFNIISHLQKQNKIYGMQSSETE